MKRIQQRRKRRHKRMALEALEPRLNPTPVVLWNTIYDTDISKTIAYNRYVDAPVSGVRSGEDIRVEVTLHAGPTPPGPTILHLGRGSTELVTINSDGQKAVTFEAAGANEPIWVRIENYDRDDQAHIKVQVRQRSNLVA